MARHRRRVTSRAVLRHIVLVRFRPEADEAARQAVRAVIATMPDAVSGIVALHAGDDVGRTPASADYAVVMDFESREAFARYRDHPAHRAYVDGPARVAVASIVVVQHAL
jgi:hypothetical protein